MCDRDGRRRRMVASARGVRLLAPRDASRAGLASVELAGWALIIVAMTQASIIAALSLFRLAQKGPPEWFSRRVQLWAFILVGLVQLRLVAFLVVEPLTASGRSFGAIPWAILLLGGFQLAGLTAGTLRTLRITLRCQCP